VPLDVLMQAILNGDSNQVDRLIASGIDVLSPRETPHPRYFGTTRMTPLGWAAHVSSKHSETVSRHVITSLLAGGADATSGKAVLFASTASAIEQLAQAGTPLNDTMTDGHPRESGSTALMFRAEALDIDAADLLVTLGADGSLLNAGGESALDYAIRGSGAVKQAADVDLRIRLVNSIARGNPPLKAFSRATLSVAAIDLLEEKTVTHPGPPPTQGKEYNRFPVSVRPILELLESYGGVPTGVVENGPQRRNILMLMLANRAFRYEPYDELSWLCRRYGFSLLDDADATGQSALFHIFKPDPSRYPRFLPQITNLVRIFVAYNANLNYRDNSGATALHTIVQTACRPKGSVSTDPFPCDRGSVGDCLFFRQAATLLVSAGADPKLSDFSGKSPGKIARERPNCPFTYLPAAFPESMDSAEVVQAEGAALPTVEEERKAVENNGLADNVEELQTESGAGSVNGSHSSKEVEVDGHWMEQSAALLDPAMLHAEEAATEEPEQALTAEDPEAARLDSAVVALYQKANQAYLATPGHVSPYIQINPGNGRRSTVRQAQLYEQYIFYKYYGGPGPFDPANRPGKSKHEYGYAMDIIRSKDEQRLAGALSSSGWAQTAEDEGWHWEAISAPRYSALGTFIDTQMDGLSKQWALTLSSFYERRKEMLALLNELEALRVDLFQAQRTAEDMRQQLAAESAWLVQEERRLRAEYDEIVSLDQQIVTLQNERANKRYTYCRNGHPYATCTHTDLKQKYDNELRQLDQAIESKRSRRTQLARDYDLGRRELVARRQKYAQKEAAWREQLRQVNLLQSNVAAKNQQVTTTQNQMDSKRREAATQLTGIVAKVAEWK